MKEGFNVAFQTQPQFSSNPGQRNEVHVEVRICFPFPLINECIHQLYLVTAQQVNELSF